MAREVIKNFIKIYESEPCLWQTKNPDYLHRKKKESAYQRLQEQLEVIEPNATKDTVVKKINNLRSNYRKEHKKVTESLKSGAGIDDAYEPKLWYYSLFSFLHEKDTAQSSNLSNPPRSIIESDDNETDIEEISDTVSEDVLEDPEADVNSQEAPDDDRPHKRKRGRKNDEDVLVKEVLNIVKNHFKKPRPEEDWSELFGKTVAVKHRRLPKEQMMVAEKLINDILFEAELGNLTFSHKITVSPLHVQYSTQQPPSLPSNNFVSSSQSVPNPTLSNIPSNTGNNIEEVLGVKLEN